MAEGVEVDTQATRAVYLAFAQEWKDRFQWECSELSALKPDLFVANSGFLSLAAAHALKIPAFHLASLDWAQILRGYLGDDPSMQPVIAQIEDAYRCANTRLLLEPGMPGLPGQNCISLGASAALGTNRRAELLAACGRDAQTRIVLFAFGSMAPQEPAGDWSERPNTLFLLPSAWPARPGMQQVAALPFSFVDILASTDLCISKVGYGIVSEAVRNDCPLLFYAREKWAEDPYLVQWLENHGRARSVKFEFLDVAQLEQAYAATRSAAPRLKAAFDAPARFVDVISRALG
jgi:hypothetical protein